MAFEVLGFVSSHDVLVKYIVDKFDAYCFFLGGGYSVCHFELLKVFPSMCFSKENKIF